MIGNIYFLIIAIIGTLLPVILRISSKFVHVNSENHIEVGKKEITSINTNRYRIQLSKTPNERDLKNFIHLIDDIKRGEKK